MGKSFKGGFGKKKGNPSERIENIDEEVKKRSRGKTQTFFCGVVPRILG